MLDLKPCPFCGSDEIMLFCDPDEGRDNSGPSRRVQCAGCNIEAPFYDNEAEAVEAWNRRNLAAVRPAVTDTPAIKEFRRIFHTTRFTLDIRYQPELIANVLSDIDTLSAHPCTTSPVVDHETANVDGKPVAVHVVMGNDFPAAVYASEAAAKAHCERESAKNKRRKKDGYDPIYWRVYDFPLLAAAPQSGASHDE